MSLLGHRKKYTFISGHTLFTYVDRAGNTCKVLCLVVVHPHPQTYPLVLLQLNTLVIFRPLIIIGLLVFNPTIGGVFIKLDQALDLERCFLS